MPSGKAALAHAPENTSGRRPPPSAFFYSCPAPSLSFSNIRRIVTQQGVVGERSMPRPRASTRVSSRLIVQARLRRKTAGRSWREPLNTST